MNMKNLDLYGGFPGAPLRSANVPEYILVRVFSVLDLSITHK